MAVSINEFGNTDDSSIPLGIVDLCENTIKKPQILNLIVSGFGIELSWGISVFQLNSCDVIPLIIIDEYYEEGFNV